MNARPRFLFKENMAKVKLNTEKAIAELFRRVQANENGVKSYLAKAGIQVQEGKAVTVADLKNLRELNEEAFNDMIVYLYPELFNQQANGDGGGSNEGLSETDKQGIFNLFGGLITTAGEALSKIYGKDTTSVELARRYAEQEAERTKRTLIIVGVIGLLLLIAGVIVLSRRPGMTVNKI